MHGAAAPVAQVAAGKLEAKLGLAEFLLASTDLQGSARRAVDWLIAQTRIKHAVVVLSEPSTTVSWSSSPSTVSPAAAIADFVLTRDDEAHPLIKAMHRREPTYFDSLHLSFRAPIERDGSTRLPLCGDDGVPARGLLLTSAAAAGAAARGDVAGRRAREAGRRGS